MTGLVALPAPHLLFLGDVVDPLYAKTAFGLRDWAADRCMAEFSLRSDGVTLGLPRMSPAEARAAGARSLLIGVANAGGYVPDGWVAAMVEAIEAGLDVVSGMHVRLSTMLALSRAAERTGARLIDVRVPPPDVPVGSGRRRSGRRVLTVGTDCASGKKYTALAIAREMRARGLHAEFRATGQTGIMIAGGGVPMDAVVSDFASGAAELLTPDAASDHWDVVEGQGALEHPSYAGVSLSLLHGTQPDVVVVCHEAGRAHLLGLPDFPVPQIERVIELAVGLGRLTNPSIRCAGVSLNTWGLSDGRAADLLADYGERLGLPATDPMRDGAGLARLVDGCLG